MTSAPAAMSKPPPMSSVTKKAMPPQASVATQRGYGCGAVVMRCSSAYASSAPMLPRVICWTSISVCDSRV